MRIGCDVDLCVVDTGSEWLHWLETVCSEEIHLQESCNYNLTYYFQDTLDKIGVDGFDFWRQPDLYDNLSPIEGSVKTLKELSSQDCEIVFISAIKGFHVKSKYYFLDKYFPFKDAYISTKEKGYVNVDAMIDDRLDNLYQFDDTVLKILYNTPFKQTLPLRDDVIVANSWEDIRNILLLELEMREVGNIRARHGVFS